MVDTVRLKKLRCAEGYFTAAGFAREIGMNAVSYRNRENGLVPFTAEEVVRVCNKLGLPIDYGFRILVNAD